MGCNCTKGERGDNGRTINAGRRPEDKYVANETTEGGEEQTPLSSGANNDGANRTRKGLIQRCGDICRNLRKRGRARDCAADAGAETQPLCSQPAVQNPGPPDANNVTDHPYSLSKLSQKTVNLLNGFYEPAASRHESHAGGGGDDVDGELLSLREIKLFVSTPRHATPETPANANVGSLIDSRHNAYTGAGASSPAEKALSVFAHLRMHAARPTYNFDLNVIDLSHAALLDASSTLASGGLLNNKYFKRKLNQIVLSDTLNLTKFRSSLNNYSPSHYLFVVFLTDMILDESEASLLCPDSISHEDYKRYVEKTLSKEELTLFARLYKKEAKSEDKQKYKLAVDFFNADSPHSLASLNDDLASMLGVFRSRFVDSDEESRAFKLKYLKSIQQEEIELAIQHVPESSIVWFHLTSSLTNAFTSAESGSPSALTFNQLRYKTILNSLQSKVLAHNYKHVTVDTSSSSSSSSRAEHEKAMNDFIFHSVKAQLDVYISEFNSSQNKSLGAKIDKTLAEEIFSHYELYKNLNKLESHPENRHKQSFEGKIANYLERETRHPLVLYTAASGGDHSAKEYSEKSFVYELNTDELVAKWMRKNRAAHPFIIYRFCGHTVLSSQLTTVVQSMMHQLCYLYGIHESWAFDSCLKLVDRMCSALEYHRKKSSSSSSSGGHVLMILDRVDRLIETEADQQLLLTIVKRIYSSAGAASTAIKLVMTFKKTTLMSHSFSYLMESIQTIFDASNSSSHDKICFNINSKKASLASNASGGLHSPVGSEAELFVKQSLKLLFDQAKSGADPTLKFVSANLVDSLFVILSSCRYGLKQSELLDIMYGYVLASVAGGAASPQQRASASYLVSVVWFTFKYYLRLSKPAKSNALVETLVDNNQLLYRLANSSHVLHQGGAATTSLQSNLIDRQLQSGGKVLSHVCSYYQSAFEGSSFRPSASTPALVSQFHLRAFQELPQYYQYLAGGGATDDAARLQQTFASSFVFNPRWLLLKALHSHSIFGYQHDVDLYCKLFTSDEGGFLKQAAEVDLERENNEFRIFESLFYRFLYALQQDPYQIYLQYRANFRLACSGSGARAGVERTSAYAFVDKFLQSVIKELETEKKKSSLPYLIPLNHEQIVRQSDLAGDAGAGEASSASHGHRLSRRETIAFNATQDALTYLSQIYFITSNTLVTLSESQREIRIWSVESAAAVAGASAAQETVRVIRSIKLTKAPKDLRLLDKHTAVVLLNRNLHIFDLNKCEHLHDLQITMATNVPYFEIHDNQHIVLLARNRLNIILMKVAVTDSSANAAAAAEAPAPPAEVDGIVPIVPAAGADERVEKPAVSAVAAKPGGPSGVDDMFVFKVGEDRFLNSLLVSKNGEFMVCGDEVQKPFPLLVWDLNKRKLVYDLRQAKHEFNTSIQSIGTSGRYVVCACQEDGESKNCLIVYDLATGQLYKKLRAKLNVVCVEISEESGVIISCLENGQLIIYELANGSKRFTINSNRFPVNKIRILDSNKHYKNLFLTYDTHGFDWTIRLWDMVRGDEVISSYTCPSRVIACSVNLSPLYFGQKNASDEDLLIAVALFGYKQPLVLKLASFGSINRRLSAIHVTDGVRAGAHEPFSSNPEYDGLEVELQVR